ncbi:MAG: hypothetical protein K8I02_06360, partial [Candidatus Methylomirabilis sp.]|nr:hypothetical protein [Deltaproteobacteria bacterium]
RGLAERERAIVEFLSDPAGLPFARETADAGGVDHSLADPRLSPTLSGLAAVLGEGFADSLCLASLKALFAIDGAGPASWRLNTRDPEDLGGLGGCRTRSYHSLETAECLAAAMRWLLGSEPCTVSAEPLAPPTRLYLPARPGVRFLLAMAEFIVALNGDAAADQADGVRVTHVAFEHPGVAALTLTQPPKDRLLKFLASRKERMHAPEGLAKTAAFLQGLATATPTLIPLDSLDPGTGSGLTWEHQARFDAVRRLLRHPDLAGETELVTERGAARLLLKWPGFEE